MRFYLLLVATLVVGAVVLVGVFGTSARTLIEIFLLVVALLPAVVRRTPRLYLLWHRLQATVRNTPATWDVHLQLRHSGPVDLQAIAESLVKWSGRDGAIMASEGGRYLVKVLRRFVVELHASETGEGTPLSTGSGQVDVSLAPFTIGYRTSKAILEEQLIPLLECVRDQVRPSSVVYSLRVDLPGDNPFFGLYLDQLKLHHVQEFKVEVRIPTKTTDTRVVVARDRMTVVADTIENFRAGTVAALAYQLPRG